MGQFSEKQLIFHFYFTTQLNKLSPTAMVQDINLIIIAAGLNIQTKFH